jgi:hypothetical protein
VHYGATPSSTNPRIASCESRRAFRPNELDVCYKPASLATPEVLAHRKQAWDGKVETTHDPITFNMNARAPPAGHPTSSHPKVTELQNPVLTSLGRRLAGVDAY